MGKMGLHPARGMGLHTKQASIGKNGLAEVGASQQGIPQVALFQFNAAEFSRLQISAAKLGASHGDKTHHRNRRRCIVLD